MLGYERPTKLRGERARLVGLVLPELQNPIFPAFAEVVGRRSRAAGVHAGAVHPDGGRGLARPTTSSCSSQQQVSGIVFAGGNYAQRDATARPLRTG